MSGLVKNQIVKQLARFTKNLSPNKISVKFMKGEGELHNLELNEKFLSELLELPPWLRLTKAVCNKISAKIHWTKLKTDPICLYLDRVEVDMEAVECGANPASHQTRHTPQQQPTKEKATNRYGFVEKVVDGMYVQINSVVISFKSSGFQASFQMSRLIIQSTNPDWKPEDLRLTRVKDEQRGEVLTFKEITWSTLRIDANALYDEKAKSPASSPLRLITSHSALHLTIKKRLEDCAVLSARLELILDDILWVLTHTQLQALAGFASSINQAMERAEGVKEPVASVPAGQAAQQPQYVPKKVDSQRDGSSLNMLFSQHDVPETSYHLRTGQIDFHLCDDSGLSAKERDPGANGAMHFQMKKLSLDYYPYHLAGTSRTCWPCHNEASLARAYWVNQLLNAFRALRNKRSGSVSSTHHRTHNDGSATGVVGRTGSTQPQANSAIPPSPRLRSRAHVSPLTSPQINPSPPANQRVGHSLSSAQKRPTFMYESCVVIRCDDFVIKQVTTSTTSGEGDPFLSSDKKALYLPSDMPAFQVDYTHYYYPSNNTSPVPAPNLFVQLNPIQFTFDATTCLWFNRFLRRVLENKIWSESFSQETSTAPSHVDIRVEALMPKVIIPCPSDPCAHYSDLRPQALQAQMSQASMTNTRIGANSTQTDLLVFLQRFNASKLYSDFLSFPNLPEDTRPLPNNIWLNDYSLLSSGREGEKLINGTLADVLKNKQPAQVWCISAEQVWLDFLRIDSMGNRPMPFVDAVPLSLWICTPLPGVESAHESEPSPSDVTVHSGKSPPAVVREELGQVRKRQTYWSGSQSAVASGDHKNLSPDLVARRKFTEPVQPQLLSNSLHNASSTPDLQQPPSQGENEVVFNRPVDGSNMNCTFTTADSTARQDRPCSSVPSSPRQRRTANLSNQSMESANEEKNTPQPCLSDSSSLRSLPESDSSGSQDGFVLLGRHPNGAPPAYDVVGDLPPPYEPYPQQRGPVQNGLHSSPICDAPETLPQEAPSLPEKVPLSPSSIACGGSDMDDQEPIPAQQAGLSVLVALTDRINVRFDHFQLMFLLRMQEMLVKTQEELERENAAFRREAQGESSSPAVTCSILTQDVELNVILPPKPEADTATASQNTSAIGSYHEVDILSDGRADSPDSNHISRLAPEKGSSSSKEALLSPGRNSNSKARSTSSAESLLNSRPESAQSTGGVSGRTSSASIPDAEAWSGIGQVGRRGSDSGSSINLDSGVSLKDSDGKSRRRNSSGKRVGIFAVEGSGFHVGIQLKEADTVVKVTGQEVKVDEQGTVNFEKYLNQKSLRTSRDKESMPVTPSSNPVVRVRAAFGPGAKQHELGGERGFALVKLTGVAASLLISSVQGLAECFEDELVLPPVPFVVELTNSRVTFNNDVPPTLLSAPPSVPINVAVEDVLIRRDPDGLISVKAIDTCSGVDDTDAPQAENVTRQDSIRSSSEVSLSDSVSSRIDSLENEKQALAAQLSVSRTALRSMHDERQALLHTVARLQQELSMSNREQERMQEKLIGQRRGGTTKWY